MTKLRPFGRLALALSLMGAWVAFFPGQSSAQGREQPGCYRNNEFTVDPGTGNATAAGNGRTASSEIDTPTSNREVTASSVQWDAAGEIKGPNTGSLAAPSRGSMNGHLTINVVWSDGKTSKFVSRCVAELIIENDGSWEGEFEGTSYGFPDKGVTDRTNDAIASIAMSGPRAGEQHFQVGVELGKTCNENGYEYGAHGDNGRGGLTTSTNQASPDAQVGRAGFPGGYGPQNCPSVYFGDAGG